MAGALLIKGEIDRVPEIAAAAERVFVFQSPITDAAGMLESFTQVADSPATEGPFLINGVRRPRLVMRRGEVQNWHFINAAIFNFVNLSLDGHALNVYSHDGNPRRNILPVPPGKPDGVVLAPGNRAACSSRQARRAPTTCARCNSRWAQGSPSSKKTSLPRSSSSILPLPMALPSGPLPVPASLATITDEELAAPAA